MGEMDDQVVRLFGELIDLPVEQRKEYLNEHCPDSVTRERVSELLGHHEALGEFMTNKAVDAYPEVVRAAGENVAEFKLIREIGRGGMGVVYLAEDTILGRTVALKMISGYSSQSVQVRDRFRQEAKAAAMLSHPGIVSVYRFEDSMDPGFIAMEYIDGDTLEDKIKSSNPKPDSDMVQHQGSPTGSKNETSSDINRCVEIVADVAEALDWAHQQGVIHRDIKPSNILIDQHGRTKLTDFGIAMILEEPAMTQVGQITGTFRYMSPEQIESAEIPVDHRTDVYSIGVVLYEMLSGRKPYEGENLVQILRKMHAGIFLPLRQLNSSVDKDLETICHKSIETNPENRYQSAAHLMADLRSWLRGEPILARPPGQIRKIKEKLYSRRSMLMASASAVAGVGAGMYTISRLRAGIPESYDGRAVIDAREVKEWLLIWPVDLKTGLVHKGNYDGDDSYHNSIFRLDPGFYRFSIGYSWMPGMVERHGVELTRVVRMGEHLVIKNNSHKSDKLEDLTDGMVQVHFDESEFNQCQDEGYLGSLVGEVDSFWIDSYEVTCSEYQRFLEHTSYKHYPPLWGAFQHPDGWDDLPVTSIGWEGARAYAEWMGKRLPTRLEWLLAARGAVGRKTPWDHKPEILKRVQEKDGNPYEGFANLGVKSNRLGMNSYSYCYANKGSLSDFQEYAGASMAKVYDAAEDVIEYPTGNLYHMLGNVREWTETTTYDSHDFEKEMNSWWTSGSSWSAGRRADRYHRNASLSTAISGSSWDIGLGFRCARSRY